MDPAPVLVISGPPGVGKTSVAWQVFSLCTDEGLDPALADLDLLGAAWPAPADDLFQSRLKAQNLAAIWVNFRATGSRHLVIAGVVETQAERQMLQTAVGASLLLCRLDASDATLSERIRGRGRDLGDDLPKLVRRAAELSVQLAEHDIGDVVVNTDDLPTESVARALLTIWRPL